MTLAGDVLARTNTKKFFLLFFFACHTMAHHTSCGIDVPYHPHCKRSTTKQIGLCCNLCHWPSFCSFVCVACNLVSHFHVVWNKGFFLIRELGGLVWRGGVAEWIPQRGSAIFGAQRQAFRSTPAQAKLRDCCFEECLLISQFCSQKSKGNQFGLKYFEPLVGVGFFPESTFQCWNP